MAVGEEELLVIPPEESGKALPVDNAKVVLNI